MAAAYHRAPPEIEPGVTIDSLDTPEACDGALDRLTMAIASIEEQLKTVSRNSFNQPLDWRSRAEKAVRIKKLLLPRVQQRRADLVRKAKADRHAANQQGSRSLVDEKRSAMVATAWAVEPEAMQRVENVVRERRPDLFTDEAAGGA